MVHRKAANGKVYAFQCRRVFMPIFVRDLGIYKRLYDERLLVAIGVFIQLLPILAKFLE